MIDSKGFRLVYLISAALLLLAEGVAAARWGTVAVMGGLAVGWTLGVLPLITWQWAVKVATEDRSVGWVIASLLAKVVIYSASFYFLVTHELVDGFAVGVGITLIPIVLPLVFLARPNPSEQVN